MSVKSHDIKLFLFQRKLGCVKPQGQIDGYTRVIFLTVSVHLIRDLKNTKIIRVLNHPLYMKAYRTMAMLHQFNTKIKVKINYIFGDSSPQKFI